MSLLIAAFWTYCSISVYHFTLARDLAILSTATHSVTLVALSGYFDERPSFRNWRVAVMTCQALLLIVCCVLQSHWAWNDSWSYDAQCLFEDLYGNVSGNPASQMVVSVLGILSFMWAGSSMVIWNPSGPMAIHRSTSSIPSVGLSYPNAILNYLVLMLNSACWWYLVTIGWFQVSVAHIFEDKDPGKWDMNGSEDKMSFGQIVPILLLSSTIFVFKEAYDGK